jgi:ribosomal protein L37E
MHRVTSMGMRNRKEKRCCKDCGDESTFLLDEGDVTGK